MTDLGYFAADTLNMTLYQIKGQLIAEEIHPLGLGPWRMELPIKVESDILSGTELSFWLTLGKSLHLYLVVREKENWLFVLDRDRLETCELASQTAKGRVEDIKPAIRGVFRWKQDVWMPVEYDAHTGRGNAHDLEQDRAKQSADEPAASAPGSTQSTRHRRQ